MKKIALLATVLFVSVSGSLAQGHGPLFGLQTPTLAKGGVDFNAAAMSMATSAGESYMLRYVWSYGLNEDLQINLTTPTVIKRQPDPPRTRGMSNMPANGDIEASLWYRFFSNAFGIGKRFESTAILGVSAPTEERRGEILVSNSIHAAISAGYASRTWYTWVGGGYQYYLEKDSEQLGDLPYGSLVVGYRPNIFRGDYPKPDWRVFLESLAEFPGSHRSGNGEAARSQRGRKLMAGPSFLGLYGAWGVSFGAMFPVYQDVDQSPQKEKYRLSVNLSYWL